MEMGILILFEGLSFGHPMVSEWYPKFPKQTLYNLSKVFEVHNFRNKEPAFLTGMITWCFPKIIKKRPQLQYMAERNLEISL